MKISLTIRASQAPSTSDVGRLCALGWFFGVGTLFAIVLIPALIVTFVSAASNHELYSFRPASLMALVALPFILAMQAVMVGVIGALGYKICRKYNLIAFQDVPETKQ